MTKTEGRIVSGLEACFRAEGFSEPGVDTLRDAAGVSLRTLYKYFPSREDMIVGALGYRHDRYLNFIAADAPSSGSAAIAHVFHRIEAWMQEEVGTGCLFLNALAAHPASAKIRTAVERQKQGTRELMARCAGRDDVADLLFLLHEGATAAWPVLGPEAIRTARTSALALMRG